MDDDERGGVRSRARFATSQVDGGVVSEQSVPCFCTSSIKVVPAI